MKFKQFLNEWGRLSPKVNKTLVDKGYTRLGNGKEQFAYLEPETGRVLKVFGTQNKPGVFTPGHRMFKKWVDYCAANSSNQFLPKFDGWEGFEMSGYNYLQIRMERLAKLPKELARALHELSFIIARRPGPERVKEILDNLHNLNDDENIVGRFLTDEEVSEIEKLMILLGEKQFSLLLNTISELAVMATSLKYTFDLHGANFMHRNDGIPVIVDPWVTYET